MGKIQSKRLYQISTTRNPKFWIFSCRNESGGAPIHFEAYQDCDFQEKSFDILVCGLASSHNANPAPIRRHNIFAITSSETLLLRVVPPTPHLLHSWMLLQTAGETILSLKARRWYTHLKSLCLYKKLGSMGRFDFFKVAYRGVCYEVVSV